MNGFTRTKHFEKRSQQRCVNYIIVQALLEYGEQRSSKNGIDSLIFTKKALTEIKNDYGPSVFKACEKLRNTYIIVSAISTITSRATKPICWSDPRHSDKLSN